MIKLYWTLEDQMNRSVWSLEQLYRPINYDTLRKAMDLSNSEVFFNCIIRFLLANNLDNVDFEG